MTGTSRTLPKPDSNLYRWGMKRVKFWSEQLLSVIFPVYCLHCREPFSGAAGQPLCESCLGVLDREEGGRCQRCGQFLGPAAPTRTDCRNCRGRSFAFERVYALGRYTSPLRDWIHRMKFQNRPVLGHTLGKRLGDRIREKEGSGSVIVSIPLIPYREAGRWFNQAQIIAAGVSETTGIPRSTDALVKTKSTTPQVELSREERIRNIQPDVFSVRKHTAIKGENVILVDDVMTTGSTLDAASRVLQEQGANSVRVAVLGR